MKPTSEELSRLRDKPKNGHASFSSQETLFYLQQAAVSANLLTGSPEWDRFLSQLQFWMEKTREQAQTFRLAMENPYATDDMVRTARLDLILCNERIALLDAVMKFPAQIKSAGEKAELELQRIGSGPRENGGA